nr:ribonuclease H-like domain-containing protein [Tanacetum cinerariifolium]
MQFLMGLDGTYMQIRSSILSRETLPDVRSAYDIILVRNLTGLLLVAYMEPLRGPRLKILISMLLTEETFREKNVSNNDVGSNSSNGFSNEQMATLISLIKENFVNGKGVHSNKACTYMNSSTMFNKNFEKFFCSNSSMHPKLVSKGLITDLGAKQHITYIDKNLSNVIDVFYLKIKVTHPNGTEAFITKIEIMPLTSYLTLYDVLVVPEYCVSLMSVHKVARDSKLVIANDEMHCYVMNQNLREGKILGLVNKLLDYITLMEIETSCSYTSQQNRIVERKHKHLLNVARSLLFLGGIPLNIWTKCVLTATYLINKLPTFVLNGKSYYDLVYNKPPSLKHLRSFGCLAYASILNSHDKFRSRSEKCVHVGYLNFKKGYKLWSLDNKQIVYSRDVKFFEDIFPFKKNISTRIDVFVEDINHLNLFNTNTLDDFPNIPNDEERRNRNPIRHDASASENGSFTAYRENNSNSEGNGLHDQSQENVSKPNNETQNFRRSSRTSVFLINFNDFIIDSMVKQGLEKYVNYSYLNKGKFCFATMLNKGVEPKTYLETSQHKHLVDAMNAEMDALYRNDTWEIVNLHVRRKIIGSKWVWKNKYKSDGDIERYKARLVAKGFNQKEGIDFDKTFSLVVKIVTVRCLINLSVQSGWSLYQMDINNAFLYGDLEETVYMVGPCFNSDYSLFTKSVDNVFIALLVYVDDIIITRNNLAEIEKMHLKSALKVNRYLKGSPGKGINVIKWSASGIDLKAYSDVDWARCTDTRRSITSYYVFMCGSLVS